MIHLNKITQMFFPSTSCSFATVDKKGEIEKEIKRAVYEADLNKLKQLSNSDFNFCDKKGRTPYSLFIQKHKVALPFLCNQEKKIYCFKSNECANIYKFLDSKTNASFKLDIKNNIQFIDKNYFHISIENFKKFKNEFNKNYKNINECITVEEFDAVVKGFKRNFNIKSIRKAFSYTSNPFKCIVKEKLQAIFLTDTTINAYLSRPTIKTEKKKIILDSKYEQNFYKTDLCLNKKIIYRRCFKPTRNDSPIIETEKAFYTHGATKEDLKIIFDFEKLKTNCPLPQNIRFECIADIYDAVEKSKEYSNNKIFSNNNNFNYCIWPVLDSNHFYLLVIILNKDNKILCTLIINSCQENIEYTSNRKAIFETSHKKNIPFIDCGLGVQRSASDGNCAIYSCIFGRSFVEFICDNQLEMEKIFEVYENDYDTEKVKAYIKANIVKHLPEYYCEQENGVFFMKTKKEIRDFHMQRRWEIGNYHLELKTAEMQKSLEEENIEIF